MAEEKIVADKVGELVVGLKDASLKGGAVVAPSILAGFSAGLKIGICRARWNKPVIDALFNGAKEAILNAGVKESDIHVIEVPGSFELPLAAKKLIKVCDAVICLGCLIKGETMHFEYICGPVSEACMRLGQETGKPCIFGVLCCLTEEQAMARAGLTPDGHNHGPDWGSAAVEMAALMKAPVPGMGVGGTKGNQRPNPRQRKRLANQRKTQGGGDDGNNAPQGGEGQNTGNNNNRRRRGGKNRESPKEEGKHEEGAAPAPAPAPEVSAQTAPLV